MEPILSDLMPDLEIKNKREKPIILYALDVFGGILSNTHFNILITRIRKIAYVYLS